MAGELVEVGVVAFSAVKYIGALAGTAILGILGWNVSNMKNDIDAQRKDMQKHEIEAAEKFGRIHTAMESFIGSIGRIDSNMTEMRNDIKELIRK